MKMSYPKTILLLTAISLFVLPVSVWAQAGQQGTVDPESLRILQEQAGDIDWLALDAQMKAEFRALDERGGNAPIARSAAASNTPANIDAKNISSVDQYNDLNFQDIRSNLFTSLEYMEIQNARKSIGEVAVRSPKSRRNTAEPIVMPPPEERYITLNGIIYTSKTDWVVWMNGKKIQPDALPEEAIAFEVFPNYIQVKWYDDYTNQIIPLRLRPMQRFNIDQRIFLPG